MPVVNFNLADGSVINADAESGESVMRVAKRHNIDVILAECGGACSCATCHVHVEESWLDKLPEMDELQEDMLEFAEGVDHTSRLSCQISVTDDLDGLTVNVPESQY
ncbi:MAG: 2Fe-2S iron-sulfur cluster-binding protein [Pseudomonadota bacterium]